MLNTRGYLECYGSNALKEISRRRNLPYQGITKADQVKLLAGLLFDRQWLDAHLKALSPGHRAILDTVRRQGGLAFASDLVRALDEEGVANPNAMIRDLMAAGLLLYSEREAQESGTGLELWDRMSWMGQPERELWLPPEVDALMGPPPESLQPAPQEPPAHLEEHTGDPEALRVPFASVVRDLYAMVQAIRAKPLSITLSGTIRRPDLARLNKALAPSAPVTGAQSIEGQGRSDFLYHLCGALSLVETSAELTAVEARDPGLGFFSRTVPGQARLLLDAWRDHHSWNELARAPELRVAYGYGSELPDDHQISSARAAILEVLGTSEASGQWVSIASLCRVVKQQHVEILFTRRRTRHSMHYRPPGDDSVPYEGVQLRGVPYPRNRLDKRHHWEAVEGAFILTVLTESLQWLGLVEIGLDEKGQPVAFRLTPEGAAAIGLDGHTVDEPAEAPKALVVQPNLEMVLLPEVSGFGAAIELDRFADRVSTDRAIIYRLNRESVYRGLRGGLRLDDVFATLERLGKAPIPQNVRHSLEDWGGRFGTIRLRREAVVVSAADSIALERTLHSAGIADARRIAPTAAVLPDRPEACQALRRHAGTQWCDYNALPTRVLNAEEDGRLVVPEKHLTPYLRYRLKAVCREVDPGVFLLDPGLMRAATRSGTRAPEIEQFLAGAATGPLPPRVRLALRGWGGGCREVGLASVAAVRADPETLDLLLAVPELRGAVVARPSPSIALLDEAHSAAARALLGEFGIFVRQVIDVERPAAEGPLARAEPLYALAPKDLRAVLQRAIDERRETVLLVITAETYRQKVAMERVLPLELVRSGSRYDLSARDAQGRVRTFNVAYVHAIRLLDPAGPGGNGV